MPASTRSLLCVLLSMAGIASSDAALSQEAATPPARGQLIEDPPTKLGSYAISDLIGKVTDGTVSRWLIRKTFSPNCNVDVYQLHYGTVGAQYEPTTASGALMIPVGADSRCQGPRPIVLYAHGKRNLRSFNIADLSGQSNYEGLVLALSLAGNGYIVVAPNYAGYDSSTLSYHPFLNAEQQSSDMMDALLAARTALAATGALDNQKLFITGYSQGGYVAMATHRAMQAAGIAVTASAPMSGPYAMSAFADAVFLGQVGGGAVEEFAMLVSSYQHAYGNLYATPADLFAEKYLAADTLLPTTIGTDVLVMQGQLPESAVFNSTPPTPELAPFTPQVWPEKLAPVFAQGVGADYLVTNAYRLSYFQDVMMNPDGAYPNTTTGLPPANPTHPLRQALKRNDLRDWVPAAPMLLCAGDEDPVVFYLNTQLMEGYWALNVPPSTVTVLDVDAPSSQGGPYRHLKKRFAETKKLMQWIEGRDAVRHDYHDVLVPAFCLQAAQSFFDGF